MKILFVINSFYAKGNGMAAACQRTVKYLKEMGHDVRILSSPNNDPEGPQPEFLLKKYTFPGFGRIIDSLGYQYASSDPKIMTEAAQWADVIHLVEPLVLEDRMIKIAEKLGKPLTATYHIHPENITCHMGIFFRWKGLNRKILRSWTKLTYNHCVAVQCPTLNVLDRLRRYHVKSRLELISNGVIPDKCIRPEQMPADYLDPERPLKVIYIGRLSTEKDQMTLLESMRYSTYAKRIQLVFAGQGDYERQIKSKAAELCREGVLKYEPQFEFLDRNGLRNLAASADLAVHCATIEVEGLSIMEAMQQGAVPVIAEGRYSGTSQFAMDNRSKFPEKNPEALAHRIDWWLLHPEERWEMGRKYAESMVQYDLEHSAKALEAMFENAVEAKRQRS